MSVFPPVGGKDRKFAHPALMRRPGRELGGRPPVRRSRQDVQSEPGVRKMPHSVGRRILASGLRLTLIGPGWAVRPTHKPQ
jgi:hypothetical protein